jgi:hypothetical protein
VDLILVNVESSDFTRLIRNGDRVAVCPVFESIDITPVLRLRSQPLRETKFVLVDCPIFCASEIVSVTQLDQPRYF